MNQPLTEEDKSKHESGPRPPSHPRSSDPDDSGIFRWYQDLMDRILPKNKANPPKQD